MAALAMVSVVSSYAFNDGDYVYTRTQRLKISGENKFTNGSFTEEFAGWTGSDGVASPNSEVWGIEPAVGPNGENALQSLQGGVEDAALTNVVTGLDYGTYVVTYMIKAGGDATSGAVSANNATNATNVVDIFVNTDGSVVRGTPAEGETKPYTIAATENFTDEWLTVVYSVNLEDNDILSFRFDKLATGTMVTNIGVYKADLVADVRPIESQIAFAKQLMDDENFNVAEAEVERADLEGHIELFDGMMAMGVFDDESASEGYLTELNNKLNGYLDVTTTDVATLIPGLDIASLSTWGRGGQYSANYMLDLQGGNWGHLTDPVDELRSAIQTGYGNYVATYNAYHNDFPAGKYFFTAEIRNAYTARDSWPCTPTFTLETNCTFFIGTDSTEVGPIKGEDYQRYYKVGNIADGQAFRAGVQWPGSGNGGAFYVRSTMVRAFNKDIVAAVEHVQAFKTYKTQWDAAVSSRNNVKSKLADANYPWENQQLRDALETWDPYYNAQAAKGWINADGTDAGIASTEELNDWALYQGVELYSEPDEEGNTTRLTYQVVRGYQNAVNAVVAANKPFTDLAEAIDAAKKTRNRGTNATGDRETYRAAILEAINVITTVRANTSDATREADTATLEAALEALNAATEAFLNSAAILPIVDIDFSNPFVEDTSEEPAAPYYVEGAPGRMLFNNVTLDNTNADTNFALGFNGEANDVLRVGNGTATVEIGDPGNLLTASFDVWFGNLTKRFFRVDFLNEAGERVAGFSIDRYNANVEYNDFNDHVGSTNGGTGMDLRQYSSGLGSSSVGNIGIYTDANRTHFDLVIDYNTQTVQGSLECPRTNLGRGEGAPIPFRTDIEDTKIVKMTVGSTYSSNPERRCWFDNLKITRYTDAPDDFEEDILESPWAEVDGIANIIAAQKNGNAIYNLQGVRLNSVPQKGLYIQNGRKYVVK